ncbi:MAG: tetratricopeptide repeat protein [Hyphomonadaceae bacterium]|nr:tetratricopeptide repeat protein [Hyphomonadaceae bacterium]
MTDIFEEVDESLRQDTAATVWKRIWPWLAGVIVLSVGAVGIYEYTKSERAKAIDQQAQVYDTAVTALQKPDLPAAKTAFSQIAQGEGGYAAIADHMLAGVEKEMGGDKATIEQHLKAATEGDKGLMADLATLKLAYAKADTAPFAELEATVKPLLDKGGHIAALAREVVAAKALASGDVERARTEFQALSLEIDAPEQMKVRVQRILGTLPAKAAAATTPAATPAPTTTTPPAAPAPAPAQPGQQ